MQFSEQHLLPIGERRAAEKAAHLSFFFDFTSALAPCSGGFIHYRYIPFHYGGVNPRSIPLHFASFIQPPLCTAHGKSGSLPSWPHSIPLFHFTARLHQPAHNSTHRRKPGLFHSMQLMRPFCPFPTLAF